MKIIIRSRNERDMTLLESLIPSIIIHRSAKSNIGHVLGDEIWPVFQAIDMFGKDINDFQFVVDGAALKLCQLVLSFLFD
jgi:hypothetical protein